MASFPTFLLLYHALEDIGQLLFINWFDGKNKKKRSDIEVLNIFLF